MRRPRAPRAADIAVTLQWLDDAMARYQDGMQSDAGDGELSQVERVSGYLSRLQQWLEQ